MPLPMTADMELAIYGVACALLVLANILVVVLIVKKNMNNKTKDQVICVGCEILSGICNVSLWLVVIVFYIIYISHNSTKAMRWRNCIGLNTIQQIVSFVYNIFLCQALVCKPLQYCSNRKASPSKTFIRNAIFVFMPLVVGGYWLISIGLQGKFNIDNTLLTKAAILDLPGYDVVILEPANITNGSIVGDVILECLPGERCAVVPESFTMCPERVTALGFVIDYLLLVLPISIPILWAWLREEKVCRKSKDEESGETATTKSNTTHEEEPTDAMAQHDSACVYNKVKHFVVFLLKLNFQWQFLLRPLLLGVCVLKGRHFFVDMGNKLIVAWVVILVPFAAIFQYFYGTRVKEKPKQTEAKEYSSKGEVGKWDIKVDGLGSPCSLEGNLMDAPPCILAYEVDYRAVLATSKGKEKFDPYGASDVVVA